MLRYNWIKTHFFMNTFYVTQASISSPKHRHMQLFVSDTEFMYVVPMKSKTELVQEVKQFAKENGVPTALIFDPERTQSFINLKKTASEMNCILKYIERKT